MTDYYSTLGVGRNATQEEIKKAYRKMAAVHHPDRGGDTKKFQEVEEAYRTLSDEQKRSEYDNPQAAFNQFHFRTGGNPFGGFEEMFGFRRGPQVPRNKTMNLRVEVTLKEAYTGKTVVGAVRMPSGREQTIELNIPPGVGNGDAIKFRGLGDDSVPNMPRGDIIAQIVEVPDPEFERHGVDILKKERLSIFDCLLGCKIRVKTPEEKEIEVAVPPGVIGGEAITLHGYGIPIKGTLSRGNLYIKINVTIPPFISEEDKETLRKLRVKYPSK